MYLAKGPANRTSHIAAMGVGHELDEFIRTVKFENMHQAG